MSTHLFRIRWTRSTLLAALLVPAIAWAAEEAKTVPERSEIDKKHLWDPADMFPTLDAWKTEFAAAKKAIADVANLKGTLNKGPGELLHALETTDELEVKLDLLYGYTARLHHQDTRDNTHQDMNDRALSLYYEYSQKMSWMTPELTAIPKETIDGWMAENKELAVYRQFFDNLFRQKKYVLSPREEELIALAGEVRSAPSKVYGRLTDADFEFPSIKDEKGETVELSDSAFYIFMRNPDRKVREAAYRGIVGLYAKHRNTTAALYNASVQDDIFTVKARGYDSCLSASLFGENIPVDVYNNLVQTVNANLPLLHRYEAIRKKALKLEDGVRAWDLFAPLITGQEYKVDYEQAVETITTALQPLGDEYLTPMKQGFASCWVDVFPTKGKKSGAYSSGIYGTHPYILMNFHGNYDSMSTLAHEMGHSMHSWFSNANQPYVDSHYKIFCAEVASTTNEVLLQDYVLAQTKDPKVKLHLLCEFLESIRGSLFRQTMFSEFEQRAHEMAEAGQPLTAAALGAMYREIMEKYYGPAYAHDELVDNYWIRIPHFYRSFYVYKYSTSFCAASNIASRVGVGKPGALEGYMAFLKGGCSEYPIDLLKLAGVDMTKPEPIEDAMKLFEGLLDQTEALLKELKLL